MDQPGHPTGSPTSSPSVSPSGAPGDAGPGADGRDVAAVVDALRELLTRAKAMPMSASCIVNRAEALHLVDRIAIGLPAELELARGLLDGSHDRIAEAEAEANRIVERAREQAVELASHTSILRHAEEAAARVRADSDTEAEALRVETDAFIDDRMASFESVLQKTASQVRTARARLSERSRLDDDA